MAKILIVYYSLAEKGKVTSEERVVNELESIFSKSHKVKKVLLESKKKLSLKEQFKLEKELTLNEEPSIVKGFDLVIIGSPIVGSLTSAPLVNCFLRGVGKSTESKVLPKFALFSTGVIPGFAIKKMQSLLSMNGIKPIESKTFTSIFEFDSKKIVEVKEFAEKLMEAVES